jgi:hypothetical protein
VVQFEIGELINTGLKFQTEPLRALPLLILMFHVGACSALNCFCRKLTAERPQDFLRSQIYDSTNHKTFRECL